MNHALLTRSSHTDRPSLTVMDDMHLAYARVHELCGRARRTLAMQVAARAGYPVIWIAPQWGADPLNPDGMREFTAPQQFIFVTPRRPEDLLWCMEEALRAGAVPLVVVDLPGPPALTPVRRLHLAAETAAAEGRIAPIGLILTPAEGGAQGVESRWQLEPDHRADRREWVVTRLRARTAPMRQWHVTAVDGGLKPVG